MPPQLAARFDFVLPSDMVNSSPLRCPVSLAKRRTDHACAPTQPLKPLQPYALKSPTEGGVRKPEVSIYDGIPSAFTGS